VLTKHGEPIDLGSRSLEILIVLLARANEVVSKRDLLRQVWPDAVVEEGSLRFHIASLRKALGDGSAGARYITTVPGRGYCFVAPIVRSTGGGGGGGGGESNQAQPARTIPQTHLPARLLRMVGRTDDVHQISARVLADRFVTVLGSGGVGKTTVAIAVGHDLLETFSGAVVFVDLGALSDPTLVAPTLASMLGLFVRTDDAMPGLVAHVRDQRMLLILDTCEHLIEPVAELASTLFTAAKQAHILTTSREALRAEGEHVCKLGPLDYPPDDPHLPAAALQSFAAVQLFIERARAAGARFELDDANLAIIASICRKLDGVALAIELASGRVHTHGLERTAALLDERLTLSWPGLRTAHPRQHTLQATLDWSYELLSPTERTVLRRLAVFVGYFTFEAALQVVTDATLEERQVFRALESLIDKSMVAALPLGAMMRYRLLDTTRAYASQIEQSDDERTELAARHAAYYRRWLERVGAEWPDLSNAAERAPHLAALGNVRAALEWCFGPAGNPMTGLALAAAAAPVFLAMSLLTECHRWSQRALASLPDSARGGPEEMRLRAGLGMSLMFTRDHGEAASAAFTRSLEIAEARGDAANQMLMLAPLHMFHFRRGEYRISLDYARRSAAAAAAMGDPATVALARCLTGISLHSMGELNAARTELEATLRHDPGNHRTRTLHLGFDYYNWAGMALGRTLWLQGYPDQAIARVRQTIQDAERLGHPVTLTIVLHWAASVFLWLRDLDSAEAHIDRFLSRAETHSLGPYLAVGRGLKGDLAIRRGEPEIGVGMLRDSLESLHAARYRLVSTAFSIAMAQGLGATHRADEGVKTIDETIRQVEKNGDASFMPELLRVKSQLLLSMTAPDRIEAESCLHQSLEWSRRQSARSWELRTATDLATLLLQQGQCERALALLKPIADQFTEGAGTADLQAARQLLSAGDASHHS